MANLRSALRPSITGVLSVSRHLGGKGEMGPKALAVGVLLFSGSSLLSGCALKQNPSIVKGSWPDGRIDAAARPLYMLGPAPSSPLAPVSEAPQPPADPATWAASTPSDEGISAAELNRRQILQPIFFDYDRSGSVPISRSRSRAMLSGCSRIPAPGS